MQLGQVLTAASQLISPTCMWLQLPEQEYPVIAMSCLSSPGPELGAGNWPPTRVGRQQMSFSDDARSHSV